MATTFDVDGSVRWKSADDLSRSEAPFDSAFDLPNRPHRLADLKAKNMFRSTGDLYGDSHDSLMRDLAHQISLRDLNSVSTSDLISGILSPHTVSKPSSSPSSSMGYSAPSSAPSKMIPALIEVRESVEDDFLRSVISDQTKFELSPAFTIYMVMRYLLSPRCSVGLSSPQRNQRLRSFAMKIADRLRIIIQENVAKGSLAFWLANASELLNMFKQDVDLSQITSGTIQSILSECVESAFLLLCSTMKQRLSSAIPSLSDPKMDDRAAATDTIVTFEEVIVLLRRCHLNAALTIQVFSQLFYFLNVTLFNWLVSPGGAHCCSTAFGVRLKRRLEHIHTWAKQKGLELAAECHMDRIQQAAVFLSTPKTMNEIKTLGSTCYVLNSLQVRWLLEHVVRDVGEEPLSDQLIENVVYLSQTQADKTAAQDGISVELREQTDLLLPFLLPQDGYAADSLRGIPPSLLEYVKQLETKGLCRMLLQPGSPGIWTVHFQGLSSSNYYPASQVGRDSLRSSETVTSNYSSPTPYKSLHPSYGSSQYIEPSATLKLPSLSHNTCVPEVILVSFFRGTSGIGLSIVAAQGIGERSTGIYVKKVVEGSAAHRDGRLQPGDQLLSVNGQSLVGISQEEAASKMASAGHTVHFEVSKQAARYNGLSEWLTNPPDTPVPQPYPRTMQKTPSGGHYSSTNTDVAQYPIDRNYSETGHQTSLGKTYHSPQSSYGSRDGVPFSYTNTSGLPPRGAYSRSPNHYAFPTNEPCHLRSTRSASASELYPDQTVTNSSTSATSLQQRGYPFIPSNKTNHYGASSSHYHHNLPSYYRSSTKAEQQRPMVIQPGRRSPVASHSHLKEASNVHYQSQPSTSNYSRPPERFSSWDYVDPSASSSPITDYAGLPLVENLSQSSHSSSQNSHHSINNHRIPISNSTSTRFSPSLIPLSARTSSGETSSPDSVPNNFTVHSTMMCYPSSRSHQLDGCDVSIMNALQMSSMQNASDSSRQTSTSTDLSISRSVSSSRTREELTAELDKIEAKGTAVTDLDRQKYRQLVNELAKMHEPSARNEANSQNVGAPTGKLVREPVSSAFSRPAETFQKVERPTDISGAKMLPTRSEPVASARSIHPYTPNDKQVENLIDVARQQLDNIELTTTAKKSDNTHPIVGLSHSERVQRPSPNYSTNGHITFDQNSSKREKSEDVGRTPNWSEKEVRNDIRSIEDNKLIYAEGEETEPRVQILGKQEVYRDPRQKRLKELEQKQTALHPVVDGATLGFRDKMKLFAEQIGERTPKARLKVSSAQREIENTNDTST